MSDILYEKPLLMRACEAGEFGKMEVAGESRMALALFTFLDGKPCDEALQKVGVKGRQFVCMTQEWANCLREMGLKTYTRRHMQPQSVYRTDSAVQLPDGYVLTPFDEEAFAEKPFGHGAQYCDYADFSKRGSGAVVRYDGKIVAAASSFLSYGNEVEMDISTEDAHRRKGLAYACAAAMLRDCMRRGITVHWDAQNDASMRLAMKLGYEIGCEYEVFLG